MLYNKYRPHKFKDIVGQRMAVSSLREQSKREKFFSVYILCGQFGSGKTSTARILAMAANCRNKDSDGDPCLCCPECRSILEGSSPDFYEIAAAVNTGVDKVRDICENAAYLPAALRKKVYIIDEVQALSKAAFQAFLKILEEPPEHAMFILATTDVGAIPPTVRSRAATYYFSQLSQDDISGHIQKVSGEEGIPIAKDAADVIAKYSQGSMRDALSLFEMAAQSMAVTGADVEKMMGVSTPDAIFQVIDAVLSGDAASVVRSVTELTEGGADLSVMVSDMIGYVADLTVTAVAPDAVKGSEHYRFLLQETALKGDASRFSAFADGLLETRQMMRKLPETSTVIVALIRLSRSGAVAKEEPVGTQTDEVRLLRSMVMQLEGRIKGMEEAISHVPSGGSILLTEKKAMPEPVGDTDGACSEEREEREEEQKIDNGKEGKASAGSIAGDMFGFLFGSSDVRSARLPVPDTASDAGPSVGKEHCMKLRRLALGDAAFAAALDCCNIEETSLTATIVSDFPAVEAFIRSCLKSYENRGIDAEGITVG